MELNWLNGLNGFKSFSGQSAVMEDVEIGVVFDFGGEEELVFKWREKDVALDFAFDEREIDVGTVGEGFAINLCAPTDEDFASGELATGGEEVSQIWDDRYSLK